MFDCQYHWNYNIFQSYFFFFAAWFICCKGDPNISDSAEGIMSASSLRRVLMRMCGAASVLESLYHSLYFGEDIAR